MGGSGKKRGREGMVELGSQDRKEEVGGRGLKRCTSKASSRSEEDGQKTPCLWSVHGDGLGPMIYCCVDFDGKGYRKRNFCKKCSAELSGDDDDDAGEGKKPKHQDLPPLRRITPLESKLVPYGDMVVALGSTVYSLGGGSQVFYFETGKGEEEERVWKNGPDMLNPRRRGGKAVAVDGKIYVFGGNDLEVSRDPWAEVFDPVRNEWKPLPPPLEYLTGFDLRGPIVTYGHSDHSEEEGKKIMVGNETQYVYHVKSGTWEKLAWQVYEGVSKKPIGVGNMLYFTAHGKLIAINMRTQRRYNGEIKGTRFGEKMYGYGCFDIDLDAEPDLVHLGGREFCFFTIDNHRVGTKVRCTKFRVSKVLPPKSDGKEHFGIGRLKGSVLSSVAYIVDQPLEDYGRGLLLNGVPGGIKEVEGSVSKAEDEHVLNKK